jgi:hypothetical protein
MKLARQFSIDGWGVTCIVPPGAIVLGTTVLGMTVLGTNESTAAPSQQPASPCR